MVTHTTCQQCQMTISGGFARVFGDETNTLHACPNCTTPELLHSGAAAVTGEDGVPRSYRPGHDEPQPAVVRSEDPDETEPIERMGLEELRRREASEYAGQNDEENTIHHDEQFAAIAAE